MNQTCTTARSAYLINGTEYLDYKFHMTDPNALMYIGVDVF